MRPLDVNMVGGEGTGLVYAMVESWRKAFSKRAASPIQTQPTPTHNPGTSGLRTQTNSITKQSYQSSTTNDPDSAYNLSWDFGRFAEPLCDARILLYSILDHSRAACTAWLTGKCPSPSISFRKPRAETISNRHIFVLATELGLRMSTRRCAILFI